MQNEDKKLEPRTEKSGLVDDLVILRDFEDAWQFVDREWGFETSKRPTTNLTTVAYVECVLHDFLDSEEKTLMLGDDGNYYTMEDKEEPYGDYATTEFEWYGRFINANAVRAHLAI